MATEARQNKLERLRLIHRGHRSALTKLIKEINALVEPAESEIDRLRVISEQLDGKLKMFSTLDSDMWPCVLRKT